MANEYKFFMVISDDNIHTPHRYTREIKAQAVADEMAKKTGNVFYVMEAVSAHKPVLKVETIYHLDIRPMDIDDDTEDDEYCPANEPDSLEAMNRDYNRAVTPR